MLFKKTHIAVIVVCSSFFQTHAQSNFNSVDDLQNYSTSNEVMENKVLEYIALLKEERSWMNDSSSIEKLNLLGHLAITQSFLKGVKTDRFQRSGWWMLSYPVAIKYGLIINSIIDERKNLEKSTWAAYNYWIELKSNYGNDELADLAFLESPMSIEKYLYDSVTFQQEHTDLLSKNALLARIKNTYNKHILKDNVGPEQSIISVQSNQPMSFNALHQFLQISISELEAINQQWVSNSYDPSYGTLNLPISYQKELNKLKEAIGQKTKENLGKLADANTKRIKQLQGDIPDLSTYKAISYKVKMGDNLGQIAQHNHVKISSIRAWNALKGDRINAGQRLTIYVPIHQQESVAKAGEKKFISPLHHGEYEEYVVQPGDTLWSISKKYEHSSIKNIMADNGIDEHITPDQIIRIRNHK